MIRVMLVDDQRLARLGFQLMLDDVTATSPSSPRRRTGKPPSTHSTSWTPITGRCPT